MNSRRILLTWGVVWLLVSMAGGLCLGPQVNTTREAKESHFVKALESLSRQDSQGALKELKKGMEREGDFHHLTSVHTHAACMAIVALLIGLVQPFLGLSDRLKVTFAFALIAGTILHEAGVLIESVNLSVGMALAAIGALTMIISVIAFLVGVLKYVPSVK